MVKVFELRELSMKFERHLDCEVVDLAVSKQTQTVQQLRVQWRFLHHALRSRFHARCRCWDRRGASLPSCWQIEQ